MIDVKIDPMKLLKRFSFLSSCTYFLLPIRYYFKAAAATTTTTTTETLHSTSHKKVSPKFLQKIGIQSPKKISKLSLVTQKKVMQSRLDENSFYYSQKIKEFIKNGNINRAFDLLRSAVENNLFSLNTVPFNTLIKGYADVGYERAALAVYHFMEEKNIQPDQYTFSLLFNAFTAAAKKFDCEDLQVKADLLNKVYTLYGAMQTIHNITPTTIIFNSVLGAVGKYGTHSDLQSLFPMSKSQDNITQDQSLEIEPDIISYQLAIQACSSFKLPVKYAEAYLKNMLERGIKPDERITIAMIDAFKNELVTEKHEKRHIILKKKKMDNSKATDAVFKKFHEILQLLGDPFAEGKAPISPALYTKFLEIYRDAKIYGCVFTYWKTRLDPEGKKELLKIDAMLFTIAMQSISRVTTFAAFWKYFSNGLIDHKIQLTTPIANILLDCCCNRLKLSEMELFMRTFFGFNSEKEISQTIVNIYEPIVDQFAPNQPMHPNLKTILFYFRIISKVYKDERREPDQLKALWKWISIKYPDLITESKFFTLEKRVISYYRKLKINLSKSAYQQILNISRTTNKDQLEAK